MSARFTGIKNLYGEEAFARLSNARVCVVGLGGVGSWVAEALARSGIGHLTFVDLDDVCETNVNRQLVAVSDTIGRSKVSVMAERALGINPEVRIVGHEIFFSPSTADEILSEPFSVVVDAIDGVSNKALLIATCVKRGIPIVATGGAGARKDPSAVQVLDLAFTSYDRLLEQVRKKLKNTYDFPRKRKKAYGVPCVFSTERTTPVQRKGACEGERMTCNNGLGTVSVMTGLFGLLAANEALRIVLRD